MKAHLQLSQTQKFTATNELANPRGTRTRGSPLAAKLARDLSLPSSIRTGGFNSLRLIAEPPPNSPQIPPKFIKVLEHFVCGVPQAVTTRTFTPRSCRRITFCQDRLALPR